MATTSHELLAALRRRFEGLRLKPYYCPAHVATIGEGSTRYEDGSAVQISDPPITVERAQEMGYRDGAACLHVACKLSPQLARLENAARRVAVADFIYNLGATRYSASTLRRKINEGNWPEAKREMGKWVWGGGRKLPGLVKRRAADAALL